MKQLVFASVLMAGCAYNGDAEKPPSLKVQAKSICEVMSSPTLYLGKRILIRGVYFSEPHQRLIYDDTCPQHVLRVSHSLKVKGSSRARSIVERYRKIHATVDIPVIYSGVLTDSIVIAGCKDPGCVRYSLEDSELLAAFPQSNGQGRK